MMQASSSLRAIPAAAHAQRGVSLIEVLVGLTIGLLVLGIAIGAIMVSRQLASTTSEATRLQQQASYALRVIGDQVRQAGALELNLAFNQEASTSDLLTIDPADPVAFLTSFDRKTQMLKSSDERPLQVGYASYKEKLTSSGKSTASQLRDCFGSASDDAIVGSSFFLVKDPADAPTGELRCKGSSATDGTQALIKDVADFQIGWLRQQVLVGVPSIDRVNAATAGSDWRKIYAVEVCIEMAGSEQIDTGNSTYRPCSWKAGDKETARGNRMRLVLRNTFQLRTQAAL